MRHSRVWATTAPSLIPAFTPASPMAFIRSPARILTTFLASHPPHLVLSLPPRSSRAVSTQRTCTYNPISATWDLICDAKLANEALLTLGLPAESDILYRYACTLEFNNLPDYEGLHRLFRALAERMGMDYDGVYDWTVPPKAGHAGRSASESRVGGHRYCEACNARRR